MRGHWVALSGLSAAYWAAVLLLPALPGVPVNDDWAYARTAYELARSGVLRLSDWGTPNLVVQAAWGALFCRIFGETPTALRLSTLTLAWLGGLAFYFIALRLKLRRPVELAAVLLFSPLYFVLSASYMTDVQALALGLIGLAFALDARPRALWAASAFFALAYGVRQNALALPAGLTLWFWSRGELDRRKAAALWTLPLAAVAAHALWYHGVHGATLNRFPLTLEPLTLIKRLAAGCLYAGLFALPLAAAFWADRPLQRLRDLPPWRWLVVFFPLPFFLDGSLFSAEVTHHACSYLTSAGLGCWNIEGAAARFPVAGMAAALTVLSLLAWPALAAGAVPNLICLPLVLFAGAVLPGASFFDRYWLPLLPAALAAGAAVLRPGRSETAFRVAALCLTLVTWCACADYLRATRGAWSLGEEAVKQGIPAEQVKASRDWCSAWEWPAKAERLKAAGSRELMDIPSSCLGEARAVVSFRAHLQATRPVLAQTAFFSPLFLRREKLFLYRRF